MATGNIIIGPNNNTGLYTGVSGNTSISGGGTGTGNYSNSNVQSYLQVLTSNISTTGNITANVFFGNSVSVSGNVRANIFLQASGVVRLGTVGGTGSTGNNTVSLGRNAGAFDQQANAIAIGAFAGNTNQGIDAVAIGRATGLENQSANTVAIGIAAGQISQGDGAIAIGRAAGNTNQGVNAFAIGFSAGLTDQGANAVALGFGSGNISQGTDALAIMRGAGNSSQGESAIAIGVASGQTNQGANAVAIGRGTGNVSQGEYGVGLGYNAARTAQGANAIAIGTSAGGNVQGANSIAIGKLAGYFGQTANSIVINASGNILNGTRQGLFINPVRNDTANVSQVVFFNTGTKELTYAPQTAIGASYSNANVQAFMPAYSGDLGNVNDISAVSVSAFSIVADSFSGDGSNLSNIDGANIINGYGNTDVEAYLPTYSGDLNPGNVSASGNITGGSLLIAGDGTVVGNFNVLGNLTYTGVNTITTSNLYINLANNQTTYANINSAGIVVGNASSPLTQFQYSVASNTWITNIGISALGNVHGANIFASGNISAVGNLSIASISSSGTIATGGVSASGNVRGGNINTVGAVSATGTITGSLLLNTGNIIRLGQSAGNATSAANVIAIGRQSGQINQGDGALAIGFQAGNVDQGGNAIAIGRNAGSGTTGGQGANAIAIGRSAGNLNQGYQAIALGQGAGNNNQGIGAIAIGRGAGYTDQPANSIIITASGNMTGVETGFYVSPVRNDLSSIGNIVFFNSDTNEVTYADAGLVGSYSNANVESYLQVLTTDVSTTGNVYAQSVSASGNVNAGNVYLSNGSKIEPQGINGIQISANSDGVANGGIQFSNDSYSAIFANTTVYLQTNTGSGAERVWTFGQDADLLAPGNISTAGNVVAGFLYGDGSNITGLPTSSYSNANVESYLQVLTSNVSTTGNITASFLYGDGSNITGLPASYANSNVESYLQVLTSNVSTTGNITASFLYGDGSNITGIVSSYGNANVADFLPTYTGNLLAENVSVTGNVYAPQIVSSNVMVYGNSIITGNLTVQGTTTTIDSNIIIVNDRSITLANNISNISLLQDSGIEIGNSAGNPLVTLTYDVGTNSWQSNVSITPAGNGVSNLGNNSNYWNNVYSTTLINSGNISAIGNITGDYIFGNGSQLTGLPETYSNANVATFLADFGSNSISTSGNITTKTGTFTNGDGDAFQAGNTQMTLYFQSGTEYPQWIVSRHSAGAPNNAIDFFTSNGGASSVYPTNAVLGLSVNNGNVGIANIAYPGNALDVGGNVYAVGNISAEGNVVGAFLYGDGSNIINLPAGYANSNVESYLQVLTSDISTTGNISGGNMIGSYLYGDGSNITGLVSTYDNANVATFLADFGSNIISTTGTIQSTFFIGNGTQLTGTTGSNVIGAVANATYAASAGSATTAGTVTGNAQANITSVGTLTSLTANGLISTTGNISGNYILGNGSLLTGITTSYGNANVAAFLPTYTGNIGNTGNSVSVQFVNYKDVVVAGGSVSGTITPNPGNGSVINYTLTGNITLNAFGGTPQAGQSMTIILTQDSTGNRMLTSSMKFAGGAKTLSTAANATDIIYTFYDGTNYYATLSRAYQ